MAVNIPALQEWDKLSLEDCNALIAQYRFFKPGFFFKSVESIEFAGRKRHVAFYEFDGSLFALIPGGKTVLGYDRKKPFKPTPGQRKSWEKNCRQVGAKLPLSEYLNDNLSPLRTVELKPFLMEVRSSRLGLMPVPVREKGRGFPPKEHAAIQAGFNGFRQEPMTHQLAALIAATSGDDLRLPSIDEWEYACGAGERTLFRWGDYCPVDCYPAAPDDKTKFTLHAAPNGFGLLLPHTTREIEWCAEAGELRGGDGGGNLCGSVDWFVGWLPLATAFVYKEEQRVLSGSYLRRAFSL
jgi:hypothetical protein